MKKSKIYSKVLTRLLKQFFKLIQNLSQLTPYTVIRSIKKNYIIYICLTPNFSIEPHNKRGLSTLSFYHNCVYNIHITILGEMNLIHTLQLTHRLNRIMYNEIVDILPDPNKLPHLNEINTNYYKPEGISIIRLKKVTSNATSFQYYGIEILLNPIRLIEKDNHIQVTSYNDFNLIMDEFDRIIKGIHPQLPDIFGWTCKRIDYAVDIKTKYVKEYVELFQKGDKPSHFKDGKYDDVSHRHMQKEGSMYYISKSVVINFYDKHAQKINESKANPFVTQQDIDNAEDILRIEVQCLKGKTDYLDFREKFDDKEFYNFLSLDLSKKIITSYYDKTIGDGDFYNLNEAITYVKKSDKTTVQKKNMINILSIISQSRSIWRARENFIKGYKLKNQNIVLHGSEQTFNKYLNSLRRLGINPITMPRNWNISWEDWLIENGEISGKTVKYLENPKGKIYDNLAFIMDWDSVL